MEFRKRNCAGKIASELMVKKYIGKYIIYTTTTTTISCNAKPCNRNPCYKHWLYLKLFRNIINIKSPQKIARFEHFRPCATDIKFGKIYERRAGREDDGT